MSAPVGRRGLAGRRRCRSCGLPADVGEPRLDRVRGLEPAVGFTMKSGKWFASAVWKRTSRSAAITTAVAIITDADCALEGGAARRRRACAR